MGAYDSFPSHKAELLDLCNNKQLGYSFDFGQ